MYINIKHILKSIHFVLLLNLLHFSVDKTVSNLQKKKRLSVIF